MDCLNVNFPVAQPDKECGNYEWMSIRAGADSSFSKRLEVCGVLDAPNIVNVQFINGQPYPPEGGGGDMGVSIECPVGNEIVSPETSIPQAITNVAEFFCIRPINSISMEYNLRGALNYNDYDVTITNSPLLNDPENTYMYPPPPPYSSIGFLGMYFINSVDDLDTPMPFLYIPYDNTNNVEGLIQSQANVGDNAQETNFDGPKIRVNTVDDPNLSFASNFSPNVFNSKMEGAPLAFYFKETGLYQLNIKMVIVDEKCAAPISNLLQDFKFQLKYKLNGNILFEGGKFVQRNTDRLKFTTHRSIKRGVGVPPLDLVAIDPSARSYSTYPIGGGNTRTQWAHTEQETNAYGDTIRLVTYLNIDETDLQEQYTGAPFDEAKLQLLFEVNDNIIFPEGPASTELVYPLVFHMKSVSVDVIKIHDFVPPL